MSTMTDSDLKTRDSSSQDKDLEKHGAPTSVAVINASGHVSLMSFFLRRDFSGTSYLRKMLAFYAGRPAAEAVWCAEYMFDGSYDR